jgi:hypothetical protein
LRREIISRRIKTMAEPPNAVVEIRMKTSAMSRSEARAGAP